jgi:hypothetical protein
MASSSKQGGGGISAEEKKRRREERRKKRDENLGSASIREISSAIDGVADQLDANEKKQDRSDDARKFREKVTIALIALTFAAAAVGDYIFHETEVDAGRAWLAARAPIAVNSSLPKTVGDTFFLASAVENVGHGPALNILRYIQLDWIHRSPNAPISVNVSTLQFGPNETCSNVSDGLGVIWPGGTPHGLMGDEGRIFATPQMITGQDILVYEGCFTYWTFSEKHKTGFCYYLAPQTTNGARTWQWDTCPGAGRNFAD